MTYRSPFTDLPDEYMRLVGIIATHWEWAELLLERAIAEVGENDYTRVALLTNVISFSSKCDLILVYARHFETEEPETWRRFTAVIKGLRDAYSQRNEFVHAQWKQDATTGKWGKATLRTKGGKLTRREEEVAISRLEVAAQQIWDAADRFAMLCQEFGVLVA